MKFRIAFPVFALASALLATTLMVPPLAGAVKDSSSVVKATAKATKPDDSGKQTLTVNLEIEKPYHIYANPVELDDLADVQTVMTVKAKRKPRSVKVTYPEGETQRTGALVYKVYEGKVTLKAEIQRAKGDTSPLEVKISVQACTKSRCLLPGEVKLTVK
jgi:DsbC/DsbD-like thiol-disulfide interchange protein